MTDIKDYSKQYNAITRQLLEEFYSKKKHQNLVISPFSALIMLAIAADATAGKTRSEISDALSSGMPYDEVLAVLKDIQKAFTANRTFSSANAVCVSNTIEKSIVPAYAPHLNEQFGGELFSSEDIVADVNKWVKENTRGMIDKIADDSMRSMVACIMNASAFNAKWADQYSDDDIYYREFRNSDKTIQETTTLNSIEDRYIENESFTGFIKPYKDREFSFMALLPKRKTMTGMKQALQNLDLTEIFYSGTYNDVRVSMPEFDLSFNEDLTGFCKNLGINEIFSEQADFSPLSNDWLVMTSILHKAKIEVNRQGTKAAAVTAGMVFVGCARILEYKTVDLNRPFVFAVMHNETGLPVFTGIVNML